MEYKIELFNAFILEGLESYFVKYVSAEETLEILVDFRPRSGYQFTPLGKFKNEELQSQTFRQIAEKLDSVKAEINKIEVIPQDIPEVAKEPIIEPLIAASP